VSYAFLSRAGGCIYMAIIAATRLQVVPEGLSAWWHKRQVRGGSNCDWLKRGTATSCGPPHRREFAPNTLPSYRQRNPSTNPDST